MKKNPKFSDGNPESGMSIVLVLLGVMVMGISMQSVMRNTQTASKENRRITESIRDANASRFVDEVISDDQLCMMTDFTENFVNNFSLTKPNEDILLKDNNALVNYEKLQEQDRKVWPFPADGELVDKHITDWKGVEHRGKGMMTTVAFFQPKNREVLKHDHLGADGVKTTLIRIPINVRSKGVINGAEVIENGGIHTFIELDPLDPAKIVSCYKAVSSRSLCLDAGGKFDHTNADIDKPKCQMPGK